MDFGDLWKGLKERVDKYNVEIWDSIWKDSVAKDYMDGQKEGAQLLNIDYGVNAPQVIDYYREHGAELVKTLTETDKVAFGKLLEHGAAMEFKVFQTMLDNSFVDSKGRAKLIWDNERHLALVNGTADMVAAHIEQTGDEVEAIWHHSGNPNPRPNHLAMDGVRVHFGDTFPNGEAVPTGINCGCWIEYKTVKPAGDEEQTLDEEGNVVDWTPEDIAFSEPEGTPEELWAANTEFADNVLGAEDTNTLEKVFMDRYPDIATNLDEVDPLIAKRVLLESDKILRNNPELSARVKELISVPEGTGFFTYAPTAYAGTLDGAIQLNSKWFSDPVLFDQVIRNDIREGWHPKSMSPEFVVTHELGHIYLRALAETDRPRLDLVLRHLKEAQQSGELGKYSQYGETDIEEGFAEAFAGLHHTLVTYQPEWLKKFGQLLTM